MITINELIMVYLIGVVVAFISLFIIAYLTTKKPQPMPIINAMMTTSLMSWGMFLTSGFYFSLTMLRISLKKEKKDGR